MEGNGAWIHHHLCTNLSRSYIRSNTSSASEKQSRETQDTPHYGQSGDDDAHWHNDVGVVMSDIANMDTKNGAKHINTSEDGIHSKSKHVIQSP